MVRAADRDRAGVSGNARQFLTEGRKGHKGGRLQRQGSNRRRRRTAGLGADRGASGLLFF